MNITELQKHDEVIVREGGNIERAEIKRINEDGTLLIVPTFGPIRAISPDKIVKLI